jgi:hypothetical protein
MHAFSTAYAHIQLNRERKHFLQEYGRRRDSSPTAACWAARAQRRCHQQHLGEVVTGRRPAVAPGGLSAEAAWADNHHLFLLASPPQFLRCGELILPAAAVNYELTHQPGSRELRDSPARFLKSTPSTFLIKMTSTPAKINISNAMKLFNML